MLIYTVAVFGIVLLTSVLLLYLLNRIEMLNYRIILAISLSSVLSSLLFPGIFYFMSKGRGVDMIQLSFTFAATIVLYIMLVFILSIVITVVIPGNTLSVLTAGLKKGKLGSPPAEREIEEMSPENLQPTDAEQNYLEEIYGRLVVENDRNAENIGENTQEAENNLEKSVDSEKNIDKMGLEAFEQENPVISDNAQDDGMELPVDPVAEEQLEAEDTTDEAENLSIEECLEEAFRLKVQEDFEGAILYFMYAMDKNPGMELAFWLVLEICVSYRSLGQVEFAREMLATYYDNYSGVMDAGIRDEIERYLV